jgi:hypothetical protein
MTSPLSWCMQLLVMSPTNSFPLLHLSLSLRSPPKSSFSLTFILLVTPDLLLLLHIAISNVIVMVSDAMEVSQPEPCSPLGITQIQTQYQKQSHIRQAAPFKSGPAPDSSPPLLHALPTEHSKDCWTAQQIVMVVPWVSPQLLISQLTVNVEHNHRLRVMSSNFHTNHLCRGLMRWTLIQALLNHQGNNLSLQFHNIILNLLILFS